MKKYMMVTPETLNKIGKCFSNADEVATFIMQMDGLANELGFNIEMRKRLPDEHAGILLLKQCAIFCLFCREHMDLIHQLVQNLDCKEMTEDEIKRIMGD